MRMCSVATRDKKHLFGIWMQSFRGSLLIELVRRGARRSWRQPGAELEHRNLLEFCATQELAIVHILLLQFADQLVTFRKSGTPPLQAVDARSFANWIFCGLRRQTCIFFQDIRSHRNSVCTSHHFPSVANVLSPRVDRIDRGRLKNQSVAEFFATCFANPGSLQGLMRIAHAMAYAR